MQKDIICSSSLTYLIDRCGKICVSKTAQKKFIKRNNNFTCEYEINEAEVRIYVIFKY